MALARGRQLFGGVCNEALLYNEDSIFTFVLLVITMTAGTAVIMWLGELITDRGIGNGMSILIFTQVVATFPGTLWQIKVGQGWFTFFVVVAVGLAVIAAVIFVEQAQRRIPVQYARRMVGPQDVRRLVDLHPAQGQPGRHHPGDLRLQPDVPAGAGVAVQPDAELGRLGQQRTSSGATTRSTCSRSSR